VIYQGTKIERLDRIEAGLVALEGVVETLTQNQQVVQNLLAELQTATGKVQAVTAKLTAEDDKLKTS
jgi:exonuclease VII small subunit